MNEEWIVTLAHQMGIDRIGFFSVKPLTEVLPHLIRRQEAGYVTGFEGGSPQERIDFHRLFPEAKTGVAIGISNYQVLPEPADDRLRGKLASVCWGEDYHLVLRRRMIALMEAVNVACEKLKEPTIKYQVLVDNHSLVDRGAAYRAGLGFFGKNNFLINEKLGSFFFIGQILLDREIRFKAVRPQKNRCGDCMRCVEACPNSALGNGYSLDPSKCISFLTQKKGETEEMQKASYLYGCDICQLACPYNQHLDITREKAFLIDAQMAYPILEEVLSLTNATFKKKYGQTACGWRGKNNLVQNAKSMMKNKKK